LKQGGTVNKTKLNCIDKLSMIAIRNLFWWSYAINSANISKRSFGSLAMRVLLSPCLFAGGEPALHERRIKTLIPILGDSGKNSGYEVPAQQQSRRRPGLLICFYGWWKKPFGELACCDTQISIREDPEYLLIIMYSSLNTEEYNRHKICRIKLLFPNRWEYFYSIVLPIKALKHSVGRIQPIP